MPGTEIAIMSQCLPAEGGNQKRMCIKDLPLWFLVFMCVNAVNCYVQPAASQPEAGRATSAGSAAAREFTPAEKARLEKLEKEGFGVDCLTCEPGAINSSGKRRGMLDSLSRESRALALEFLTFAAHGSWSSTESDQAYNKYLQAAPASDENSSSYHFIKAVYAYGKKNYKDAVLESGRACDSDPGCYVMLEVRALCCWKSGDPVAAHKYWKRACELNGDLAAFAKEWLSRAVAITGKRFRETQVGRRVNEFRRRVLCNVTVDSGGKVLKVDVTQSCGNRDIDEVARQVCLKSSPFEPPPAGMRIPVIMQLAFEASRPNEEQRK
jgi:TonB family protein